MCREVGTPAKGSGATKKSSRILWRCVAGRDISYLHGGSRGYWVLCGRTPITAVAKRCPYSSCKRCQAFVFLQWIKAWKGERASDRCHRCLVAETDGDEVHTRILIRKAPSSVTPACALAVPVPVNEASTVATVLCRVVDLIGVLWRGEEVRKTLVVESSR